MNKTDPQLKHDIEEELGWDPKVDAARIAIGVDGGTATLSGRVHNFAERWATVDACRRVGGVRKLVDELSVKLDPQHERSDSDIAAVVQTTLVWDVFVPNTVSATVHQGAVTLAGTAKWNFQRVAAERSVRNIAGVVSVSNDVRLEPGVSARQVEGQIRSALTRQAAADADSIHVEVAGGRVTLTGHATSWQSIEDAASAAWAAPGVTEVIDQVRLSMTIPE